jgi:uncharacterized protein (DUF3084 family)
VKDDELRGNLEEIRDKLRVLEEEKKKLENEKKKATKDLWMARHVISYFDKNLAMGAKKNETTKKVLKTLFSNVPKKPYKEEEA